MQVAVDNLYEFTDVNGDTFRIEQIRGVHALVFTIQPKGAPGGYSVAIPFLEALTLSTVIRQWNNKRATEMMNNAG
jgi:hypothetical protein